MLKTYLKIIYRTLLKRKLYSFINILSLFIGLASFLIIYLYVVDELSYDKFFDKSDRTYRVLSKNNFNGDIETIPRTPTALGSALQNEFPEIETTTKVGKPADEAIKISGPLGEKSFHQTDIIAADSNFFEVFDFQLLEGNPVTALKDPNSLVLTKKMADKYFPEESALGQTVVFGADKLKAFKVTGILNDKHPNTHLKFSVITSLKSYPEIDDMEWSWVFSALTTYVVLKPTSGPEVVQAKFPQLINKYLPATFQKIYLSFDEFMKGGGVWKYELQPMQDIRLHSAGIGNPLGPVGDIKYVYIFILIGVFVLLVACINYINLATALAARKAREVGLYKTFGAQNTSLFRQLMIEPLIFSFLALILAVIAVSSFLKPINDAISKDISLDLLIDPIVLIPLFLIVLLTSILAGLYPAYKFTSISPTQVLKSDDFSTKPDSKKQVFTMRKSLVIFQFVLSNALFASALIVSDQLQFLRESDVGFDRDNILILPNADKLGNNLDPFLNDLLAETYVENVGISSSLPSKTFRSNWYTPERSDVENIEVTSALIDERIIPSLGMKVLTGRNFSKDFNENKTVIINQTMAENLGWTNPVGEKLLAGDDGTFEVIGVVKDFNYESLKDRIRPFAFFHYSSNLKHGNEKYITIRTNNDNWGTIIKSLEGKWQKSTNSASFDFTFLNEEYNRQYKGENNMGTIVNFFTIFCLIIACLGLYGLVAFSVEKKRKEIGVRKALGASNGSIIYLFTRDFTTLLVIALLVAIPLTYMFMSDWIGNFRYHADINWFNFILAGGITVLIAICTVIIKTLKASRLDPAKTLKYE